MMNLDTALPQSHVISKVKSAPNSANPLITSDAKRMKTLNALSLDIVLNFPIWSHPVSTYAASIDFSLAQGELPMVIVV